MKKGDKATIQNKKLSGEPFIEGIATLIKHYPEYDDNPEFAQLWDVQFPDGDIVRRFIREHQIVKENDHA
jgi:hypothetical protein